MEIASKHAMLRHHKHCHHIRRHCSVACSSSSSSAAAAVYTQLDSCPHYSTFRPPLLDVSNLLAGQAPTEQQTKVVRQECTATGFLAIQGHGIEEQQLRQLFSAAERFFDLPLDAKMQLVVENMQRGRGYEVSPEHKQYMQVNS